MTITHAHTDIEPAPAAMRINPLRLVRADALYDALTALVADVVDGDCCLACDAATGFGPLAHEDGCSAARALMELERAKGPGER